MSEKRERDLVEYTTNATAASMNAALAEVADARRSIDAALMRVATLRERVVDADAPQRIKVSAPRSWLMSARACIDAALAHLPVDETVEDTDD